MAQTTIPLVLGSLFGQIVNVLRAQVHCISSIRWISQKYLGL